MDAVETYLATKRIERWPIEMQDFVNNLPADEAEILKELVGLLDAQPTDEQGKAAE